MYNLKILHIVLTYNENVLLIIKSSCILKWTYKTNKKYMNVQREFFLYLYFTFTI